MSFNSDLNKQAQEVNFSRKLNKSTYPKIYINNRSKPSKELLRAGYVMN